MLIRQIASRFMRFLAENRSANTVNLYGRYLRSFVSVFGKLHPEKLKPSRVLRVCNTYHRLQIVKRMFAWAANDERLIGKNPVSHLKKVPGIGRRRVLTDVEFARILRCSAPEFRMFVIAQRELLARPQEIRSMKWSNIVSGCGKKRGKEALESQQVFIVFDEYKGRTRRCDPSKPRVIPVSHRLQRMLVRLSRTMETEGFVFKNKFGLPWTRNAIRCRWRRMRSLAEIGPDERGEQIVSYTVRHTAATHAAAIGLRDKILADLLGHTSRTND